MYRFCVSPLCWPSWFRPCLLPLLAATIAPVLWPEGAFAQREHLTLKSWTACPTIQQTNHMLVFDDGSRSALCEAMKAGVRVIVDRAEQAPATRWLCIDHPAANGMFTLCKWETFQDELKMWLCVRSVDKTGPCRWGPVEYFTSETESVATPRPQ
jgi:hypothetical protein